MPISHRVDAHDPSRRESADDEVAQWRKYDALNVFGYRHVPLGIPFVVDAEQRSFQCIGDDITFGVAATDKAHRAVADKCAPWISGQPVKGLNAVGKTRQK